MALRSEAHEHSQQLSMKATSLFPARILETARRGRVHMHALRTSSRALTNLHAADVEYRGYRVSSTYSRSFVSQTAASVVTNYFVIKFSVRSTINRQNGSSVLS
ncbi:unnamed protein product [Trichogramma brassicae]|uniref:Uncharacterized protein n=1 Tax=Trichogramma brassicae TaxID=86971 RepID=A0A6H5I3K2_9HYME|nr:unnamed protein product [Trichogramma brassicae]